MGRVYGYIRVSTREQNEERQLVALRRKCIQEKNIFLQTTASMKILTWKLR